MEESIQLFLSRLKDNDDQGAIQLLKEQEQLLEGKTEKGISLLLITAYHQNEEILSYIVEAKDQFDIFEAAAIGKLELVKEKIEKEPALLNAYTSDGFTPLGLASYFDQIEVVRYLLIKGADPNIPSNNGMKVAPIHSAVSRQNLEIAALLIENGADVNAKQTLGVTPLHSAAHRGDLKMVKLLIAFKADVAAQMENGKTPLDFAKETGNPEVEAALSS